MPGEITIAMLPAIKDIDNIFAKLDKDINWRRLFDRVEDEYFKLMRDVFATEGAATGPAWAPLTPQTLFDKKIRGFGEQPKLVRTEAMRDGFTNRRSRHARVMRTRLSLSIGPQQSIFYAIFHQLGTKFMPARPIVRFNKKIKKKFIDIFRDEAIELRRQRFGRSWRSAGGK